MRRRIFVECSCVRNKHTGIARTILSLIKALKESGFNVIEVCCDKNMSILEELLYYNYLLPRKCKQVMNQEDVFLIPNNMGKFWRLPWKNTWVLMHDIIPLSKYGKYSFLKKKLYLFKTKRLKNASRIITISEYVKKNIIDNFDVLPENVKVLYWSAFTPINNNHVVDMEQEDYFVSIGTGEYRKNVDFLIKNWSIIYLKKFKLKLFGKECSLGAHKKMEEMIKQYGMGKYIELLGPISDEEMVNLYSHANGLIFPSLEEGFGLPPLEALQCGCNVILPKTPINYELYGDIGFFYSVGDKDELEECITEVVNIGKQNRQRNIRYCEKFSSGNFKNRVIKLFKN